MSLSIAQVLEVARTNGRVVDPRGQIGFIESLTIQDGISQPGLEGYLIVFWEETRGRGRFDLGEVCLEWSEFYHRNRFERDDVI